MCESARAFFPKICIRTLERTKRFIAMAMLCKASKHQAWQTGSLHEWGGEDIAGLQGTRVRTSDSRFMSSPVLIRSKNPARDTAWVIVEGFTPVIELLCC